MLLNKNKSSYLISPKGRLVKRKINKKAMTIIEVMIAIFIFALGLASVFMILSSAGRMNSYNRDFIIASNLAREQVELIRNIRDTNYKKFQKWNLLKPELKPNAGQKYSDLPIFTGSNTVLYKIENGNGVGGFHIKASTGTYISDFRVVLKDNSNTDKEVYRLCLENNKYVYCKWNGSDVHTEKTPFYKFMRIEQLKDENGSDIKNSFKINSSVWWNKKGIHKIEIPTILADYKRL